MSKMLDLQTALLDLLYEIQGTDIKLIIGGGFGVYLKTAHVRRLGMIRLRESPYYRIELQLDDFMSALQELFPATARTISEGT